MGKKVDFAIVDGKFVITVDPNQDGENLLEFKLNLAEVPDELVSLFSKDD